jgi:AraC-like DNA-binding protein
MRQMPRPIVTPSSASQITGMVRMAPAHDLADVVEQHWIVRWDCRGQRPIRREVLPDPSVNLSVEPSGRLLYGVGTGHSEHRLEGRGMVVGTKFRPGGFSGFRRKPVSDLSGRVLTLPEAFGDAGADLDLSLTRAADVPAIIELVSAFLRAHRPSADPERALVMEIVEAMRAAPPGTRVSDLAGRFGLTTRGLQRLFAEHVGTTPKRTLQRFRRQQAVDLLSQDHGSNIARLAAELGYFDQAHLARDLRATLGRSPSMVAAAGSDAGD